MVTVVHSHNLAKRAKGLGDQVRHGQLSIAAPGGLDQSTNVSELEYVLAAVRSVF